MTDLEKQWGPTITAGKDPYEQAEDWIKRLNTLSNKAVRSLKRKEINMDFSYFMGHLKDYRMEPWYDYFFS